MILRKPTSPNIKLSHKTTRSGSRSLTQINSLIFLTFFMALLLECLGSHGVYRPHRPHPTPNWETRPGHPTQDGASNNDPATSHEIKEESTEALGPLDDTPDEDDKASDLDKDNEDEYEKNVNYDIAMLEQNQNINEPEDKIERQVMMIRPTTKGPSFTIININDYDTTTTEAPKPSKPQTPKEELNQMLESLDNLLSNKSAVVTVEDVTNTFDQLDVLLDSDIEFPCSMLHALDTLSTRVDLNGSQAVSTARRNVAVMIADSEPSRPVRGLRIAAQGLRDDAMEIFHEDLDPTSLSSEASEAVVNLPASLSKTSRRISFVVFQSDRAFARHDSDDHYVVNSNVISVNVENFTKMEEGEVIDVHLKPTIDQPARNMSRACAYWHFAENGTGYWSQEGCRFIRAPTGQLDTCRCTHLTHFAEVLVPKAVFSETDENLLEILSLTGCFLSLFGLIIIVLTAILFRSWRNDFNNKIWIQLTLALFLNVISFLIVVFSKFEDYNMFCFFVGIMLHYAVLASFCWMLIAAIISYRKLVLIFARDPSHKLLKASAFSWVFPLAVVTILVAVAPESYVRRFEENTPNGAFCYPTELGLWLTVYAPISLVVITNWVLFALIIRSVFTKSTIQKHGDSSELLRRASVSCLLVFLFGLPWVFGLFAYNIVAAYLFTLTTSYQGFVLFIFFVLVNTKTRELWLNKLRIRKKTKAPVSSSFLSNRSERARDESELAFIGPHSNRTNVSFLMSNSSDGRAITHNVSSNSALIEDSLSDHRYESDGSFITANSFGNICESDVDEDRSNLYESCIEGIVELVEAEEGNYEKEGKSDIFADNLSIKEGSTALLSTADNSDISFGATSDSKDIVNNPVEDIIPNPKLEHNILTAVPVKNAIDHDGSTSTQEMGNNSSRSQLSDSDSIVADIKIYNIPTQSASLIS